MLESIILLKLITAHSPTVMTVMMQNQAHSEHWSVHIFWNVQWTFGWHDTNTESRNSHANRCRLCVIGSVQPSSTTALIKKHLLSVAFVNKPCKSKYKRFFFCFFLERQVYRHTGHGVLVIMLFAQAIFPFRLNDAAERSQRFVFPF